MHDNDSLTNLDGLGRLTELGSDLDVFQNAILPTCEATILADRLVRLGWQGQASIFGNDDAGVCR